MKELTEEEKNEIIVDWIKNAKGADLLQIGQFFAERLAQEAIKCNAEVIRIGLSIHPKDVDERRNVSLLVFQQRQSETKVDDLSSLLQASPELLQACQTGIIDLTEMLEGKAEVNEDNLRSTIDVLTQAVNLALNKE